MAVKNNAKVLNLIAYTSDTANYVGSSAQIDAKIATQGQNLDFVTVRVNQHQMSRGASGLINKVTRQARLTIPAMLLDDLVPPKTTKKMVNGVEEEITVYQDINALLESWGLDAGRIIVEESFEPFFVGQQPKQNPANHPTAPSEVVLVDGREIYYQTKVVDWSSEERDSRVTGEMTTGDAIDPALKAQIVALEAKIAATTKVADKQKLQAQLEALRP